VGKQRGTTVARHDEGKAAGQGRPITRHPLFPAVAALWGAALLLVVGLVSGPGPIAGILSALHIDRLLPQAAPPFGQTARGVFALALALAGGAIALFLAHRLGRDDAARAARREASAARAQDRRALREEADPHDDLAAFTPVMAPPAGPPPVLDVAGFAAAHAALPPLADELDCDQPVSGPVSVPVVGGTAARRIVSADLATLSELELMERLALALERWRAMGGASPAVPPPAALIHVAERGPEPAREPEMVFPALAPRHPVAAAQAARVPADPAPETALDPQATEAALRSALASLRRMSGAA
jgi:hypothetical protein